ncbi:MAG: PAS domain S-box protein [Nitrospirae bacterium]|nr:PAS domain S-box protein [Nitrospirota bacterium]
MMVYPKASNSALLPSVFIKKLVIVVLLINLFVIALVGLALRQSRIQYDQRAAISTQNMSHVLEQYIADTIDKIDLALFAVADEVARQRSIGYIDKKAVNSYISRIFSRLPFLNAIRLANAQGEIVYGADTTGEAAKRSTIISDRDYFKHLRNDPNAGLVISKPVQARITGKWVIIFARRLNRPDGSFDGAVWAAIEVEHFHKTFAKLDIGRNGVISFRDSEMGLIARHPEIKVSGVSVGQTKVSQELLEQVKTGKTYGTYYTPTGSDNIARTVSFRKIGSYPLYVIVGLASSEYLADWGKDAIKMSLLTALFSLITALSSWLFYRDLTRRRQAEEEYRTIIRTALDGFLVTDAAGNILDVNDSICNILHRDREELVRMNIQDIEAVDSPEKIQHKIALLLEKHSIIFDIRHRRKDGSLVDLEISANFSPEKGGRFMSFFRDITESKRAQQAMEQADTEWSAAMDASEDIIYLLDTKRRVMRANRAFFAMTNSTPETAIGRHIVELVHPRGERVPCAVCRAQEDLKDIVLTMESDHPDNPAGRPIEITVRVVRDKQEQPMSIFMIIHDLTHDRKILEEKSLLETQLFQSQKLEAIGQLAGGVAHDFNNMLTAIIGYGSLLNTKLGKDSELKPFVDQILSSAEKSADLTRQLLAFSRKQEISPKETDLNQLIKGMEKLLLRLIGEDIELKTQLSDKVLTILVDPGKIEQVLMNLCTNARDAMPDGGLLYICTDTIKLDTHYVKGHDMRKPGMYALLSVTDTGKGIDEKTQQKIFEPFFTTKEVGRGTGLGLSIVYGIIKQHGGNITVYSEPGKGTTFRIYLPLIKSQIEEANMAEIVTPKGGTETILLAEDNEDVRVLSGKVLEEHGYRVIDAMDGEDAINKFKENKDSIQLIVIDVIMPKKSGKEAVDEIKKIKPEVKVLFTSGYTSDIISRKGILEQGMDFISKPVSPHAFLSKIREILDGGKR